MNRQEFLKSLKLSEFMSDNKEQYMKHEYQKRKLSMKLEKRLYKKGIISVNVWDNKLDDDGNDSNYTHLFETPDKTDMYLLNEMIKKEFTVNRSFCKGCNDLKRNTELKKGVCCCCINKMMIDEKMKITDFIQPDEKCPICQDELKTTDNLFIMKCCKNILHYKCLEQYVDNLTDKYSCLLCRSKENPFPSHYDIYDHYQLRDDNDE